MDATGWDHEPPAPRMPPDVDREHPRALPRGVRADHRRELRRLVRPRRVTGRRRVGSIDAMTAFAAHVEVTHLPGIADPAGATVERALPALGYTNVDAGAHRQDDPARRRRGRRRRGARAQVEEMCERLLANPVIEAYAVDDLGAARPRRDAHASASCSSPGTNCELDVVWAVEQLGGDGRAAAGTATPTIARRRRGRRARRLRARRLPAHRRASPASRR